MSNIDLVLLGLIKQKSQSAYDIKKNIEYRNIPRWVRISEQSIYKKVLQLESKEYIVSHKEKEENMPDMLNPELTASWEKGLDMVAKKEIEPGVFMEKLEKFIRVKISRLVI